jgi:hypothetical protein
MHRCMELFLSALYVVLLTSCAMDSPTFAGYSPMPNQFLGEWEEVDTRAGITRPTITQTLTGAIMMEHSGNFYVPSPQSPPRFAPSITTTTLRVFSIEGRTAYAIGEKKAIFDKTKKLAYPPIYSYYAFQYKRFDGEKSPFYKMIILDTSDFYNLTEQDMTIPASVHLHRIQKDNWPCDGGTNECRYAHNEIRYIHQK